MTNPRPGASSAHPAVVPVDNLTEPSPACGDPALRALLAESWGRTGVELRPLGAERDLNVLVDGALVLKISNPAESAEAVDMEVAAVAHLSRFAPELSVPITLPTVDGAATATVTDDSGRRCVARLITLLAGAPLEGSQITEQVAERVGGVAAQVQLGLQGFFHPAGGRTIGWDIRRLRTVVPSDGPLAALADRVQPALQATRALPSWIQHADVTLTNVLGAGDIITGVIDFGDMHHTAAICDLAVTLASVLRNTASGNRVGTWALAAAVLDGYQRRRLLEPAEAEILGELVLARLTATEAISARRAAQHPENVAYIARYDAANRPMLEELSALNPTELSRRFGRLTGTGYVRDQAPQRNPSPTTTSGPELDENLLTRRESVMGGALSPLFYRTPLHVVRGEGPWLITADGTRLLDAYNNVAVVGHAHPVVSQAVSRQLALLNTHSRYLHAGIVELAERILQTMPEGLDTCLFTTSGTEANELAWRLATAYTGGTGAMIAEHAYHGSTRWMADLSSNEWPQGYRPGHVATFQAPRGLGEDCEISVAETRVADAAETLRSSGEVPALLLADSMFTSEGILDAPPAFMRGLASGAHAAGALYLADEVQAGYGRSGPQLWRFALADVVPDMVSLGKPMGAGYPIGALVTRRDIAASLARDYEYFSTFAATPAAAAAGLAVLDVLQDRDIPTRAVQVGEYLRHELCELSATHPRLGEVRGTGLLMGIDLVPPAGTAPRPWAAGVLEALRQQGVLAGLTGPSGTVLKIRPPLIWGKVHAQIFLDALGAILAAGV
ncbi:MAG: aminotransferase class III-fold pyridoxal phosphate-dependent enzyme [Nakamurella sp.]